MLLQSHPILVQQSARFRGRREDDRLLTGQGRYTADWNLPGQLYGCFLRSDRAHAQIRSLDASAALRVAGAVRVFTGEDTAHLKTPPPLVRFPGRGGEALKVPHRDVLARGRVRFVGEAVALVVAATAQAAQDAADLIEAEYADLPAVIAASEALRPGAPQLHDSVPGNLAFDYEYGDESAVAEAFSRAARVTRIALGATRLAGNPMEPRSCLAAYDAARDVYDIYASSQGMTMMLPNFQAIFGLAADRFRLHARDVGGGFGVRSQAYPEYCALMVAAKALGRPVKWVGSRFETIASDHHGRGVDLAGALALDGDGRFVALRVDWTCNMGAYLTQAGPMISSFNPSTHAINAYRIPALYGRHRLALTNTTPTTAYRGASRPNVSYLVERLVDEAARESGIDRIELRRRNLVPADAYPYKTPTGSTYDSGDLPGLLDKALRFSDWHSFEKRRSEARSRNRLRGIGCALFVEPASPGTIPKEEAAIKFGASGDAELYVVSGPSGQGHETVFPEIVSRILSLPAERIVLKASDPDGPALAGGGTVGSRSMMAHGSALAATAAEVVRKGIDLAARELEAAAADVEFSEGRFRVKGTDLSIPFAELARRQGAALDSQAGIAPQAAYPSGAHVAEVEIDPETGSLEVIGYVAVDDCGRVINHTLLEGQLHGGVAQGLGQVLAEQVVYDAQSGQLLTGSFMDYAMPRAGDQPRSIGVHDHSVPAPGNLLGVKGAGEAGTVGALPAAANAVIDALRPLGIHQLELPYTPARLWHAISRRPGAA